MTAQLQLELAPDSAAGSGCEQGLVHPLSNYLKPPIMNREKLENFEDAFQAGTSGCLRACNCGRIFYDCENSYDWEDGELDRLEANEEATACGHSIGDLRINGTEYVMPCDCWHSKAEEIMRYIDDNAHQIASYLNAEKKRKQRDAEYAPSIG